MTITKPIHEGKPRVLLVNDSTEVPQDYVDHIGTLCERTVIQQAPHDVLAVRIQEAVKEHGPFVACIVFLRWADTWPWPLDEQLVGPLIESGCRLFSSGGAGYDFVDIQYLTRNKVYYANTAISASVRTADSAAMMILQVIRSATKREHDARAGRWQDRTLRAKDARKSVLGIVGMGSIGKLVKDHMQHFGMKVIYHNRSRLTPEEETGAQYVGFEELLKTADVITLHCPLTEDTRHLLNKDTLALTKPGVLIVNTSRGPVVHEQALVDALESGHVARAALDVFEFEPEIHPRLKEMWDRTILQPHCAVINETIMEDQQTEIYANLESFLKTGKPNTPVNGGW
ncbi:hypothetical protein BDZ89DRAFT_1012189 [Hymenopellis radicata]|nr:hypothetical protein BDZ89DRAFT_1012189 [Hymenopellis radicata]